MRMTTGDELGKSDVFMKIAVSLFPRTFIVTVRIAAIRLCEDRLMSD